MLNPPVDAALNKETAELNMRVARLNRKTAYINLITALLVFTAVVVWSLR